MRAREDGKTAVRSTLDSPLRSRHDRHPCRLRRFETTGASFATTQFAAYKTPASSAEIVAEAPSEKGIAFADFDSVHFRRCAFDNRPINAFSLARLDIVHHYDYAQTTTSRLDAGAPRFR